MDALAEELCGRGRERILHVEDVGLVEHCSVDDRSLRQMVEGVTGDLSAVDEHIVALRSCCCEAYVSECGEEEGEIFIISLADVVAG